MSAADDAQRNADRIVGRKLDRLGRAVGFELLSRLMDATPVDTGRARGNWNVSVNREDPSWSESRRAPAALAEASVRIRPLSLFKGQKLYITNGLPYIGPLNDGHSQQAPSAFIQLTTRGMVQFVNQLASQERFRV